MQLHGAANLLWSQSISSSQPTLKKSKCLYFCTKLCNRLLLSRELELFVLKSQAGHPPRRFPTCWSTPRHTLHAGHQHRHLSAPVICDPSDKDGWRHCLQPSVTFGCVCSSCCCGSTFLTDSDQRPHQHKHMSSTSHSAVHYNKVCSLTILSPCLKLASGCAKIKTR